MKRKNSEGAIVAKKKKRLIRLRFRKNDPAHNLLAAAQAWIIANGGNAVLIGGIWLMPEGPMKYRVCVGALGKYPEKKAGT